MVLAVTAYPRIDDLLTTAALVGVATAAPNHPAAARVVLGLAHLDNLPRIVYSEGDNVAARRSTAAAVVLHDGRAEKQEKVALLLLLGVGRERIAEKEKPNVGVGREVVQVPH